MRKRSPLKRPPIASFRYDCPECGRMDTWAEARERWLAWKPPIYGPPTEMEALDREFAEAIRESYYRQIMASLETERPLVVEFPVQDTWSLASNSSSTGE